MRALSLLRCASAGVALVVGGVLASGAAYASPIIPGCGTVLDKSGGGSLTVGTFTSSTCVLVNDKVYRNFANGSGGLHKLPNDIVVSFSVSPPISGQVAYTLSFSNGAQSFTSGHTYNWSYEVAVYPSTLSNLIVAAGEDFTQSGQFNTLSTLNKKVTNLTTMAVLNMKQCKRGSNQVNCPLPGGGNTPSVTSVNVIPGATNLRFDETLVDNGVITSVVNTITQQTNSGGGDVPEPASLALLGAGLAGLGAFRRKRKK